MISFWDFLPSLFSPQSHSLPPCSRVIVVCIMTLLLFKESTPPYPFLSFPFDTPQVNEPQDCPFSLRPSLFFFTLPLSVCLPCNFLPPLVGLSVFLSSCCCCQDAVRVVLDTGMITLNTPPQPNTHTQWFIPAALSCTSCTNRFLMGFYVEL